MNKCNTCKKQKDRSEFNKKASRKNGLQPSCRDCSKKSSRKYYAENRELHKKNTCKRKKISIQRSREWVFNYFKDKSCVDCGEKDPIVLEFDHVRGIKEHNVSSMVVENHSLKRIKLEINKCEIRCANCHRRKTAKDFGWWITKMGV